MSLCTPDPFTVTGGTTNVSRRYTVGSDLIGQSRLVGGSWVTHYYGLDGHGSVRFLTDTNGAVTDTYAYDAFGNLIGSSGSGTPNNYLYCCEQFDADLGFYYLRARFMNPNTGRFWTTDTFEGDQEDPVSLHKYLFVADNPVNNTDPSGNEFVSEVLDIGNMLGQLDSFVNNAQLVFKKAMSVAYRQRAFNLLYNVIRPTLNAIQDESGAKNFGGENAEYMLLGTCIAETGNLDTRRQGNNGPALGLFQMEPFTYNDLWNTTLSKPNRKPLKDAILKHFNLPQTQSQPPDVQLLVSNDSYAAIMARVRYLPARDPFPSATDLNGQAQYWVTYYNRGGSGTVANYLARWHKAMGL
jgi:RHS repeat-associated protein